MKQELGGWRVQYTQNLRQLVESTLKICPKFPPDQMTLSPTQRCDLISLEGTEFDDQSSADLTIDSLPQSHSPSLACDVQSGDSMMVPETKDVEISSEDARLDESFSSPVIVSSSEGIVQIVSLVEGEISIYDLCTSDRDEDSDEVAELTPFQTPIFVSSVPTPICDALSPSTKISCHEIGGKFKKRRSNVVPVAIEFSVEKSSRTRRSPRWAKDQSPQQTQVINPPNCQRRKKHEVRTPPSRKLPPRNGGKTKPEREACFGLWTTRYQCAATGSWTI
jgi:hypothetical protein